MTDQVEAVEESTEGEEAPYDAFADLCNRKSGVQCPNPNCNDRIFSYVADKSINCRCGLTWVSGGSLCLKYGVGYPFLLADVRVVNEKLEDFHAIETPQSGADGEGFEEAVAEELGQLVEERPEDLTVQSGEALEAEEPSALPAEPS